MKELDSILKNIKNKELLPLYFFHGEEPYYIDAAVKAFENDVLAEDEKAFNQTVVYGKDTTYQEIFSLARQFPMMGDRILIIVKEAQDLKLTDPEVQAITAYAQNPVASTVLVFAHKNKKLDGKKRKLHDALKGSVFQSDKLRDYEVPKFIQQQLQQLKLQSAPNIAFVLAEYLGNDLSRIANELAKLKMILKEGEILDGRVVETHIGISKDYNIFELQRALGEKNAEKAMKIVYYMGKNPKNNPFVMTVGNLYNFFSNIIIFHSMHGASQQEMASAMGISPYFLKEFRDYARFYPLKHLTKIISVLRESDLKNKGLGAHNMDDGELLKEMVYKILNIDKIKISR